MQSTAKESSRQPSNRAGRQIVQSRDSQPAKKQALPPRLERKTFCTSREMDFFSENELRSQTGHEIGEWPLVVVKELTDNALDACEEADIAPVIEVTADACGITVADGGPGLPESTLQGALDFTVRASNREGYVSPCRGAQGNALMTMAPMPHVVDPTNGRFIVEAHGKRHVITCGADPITERAEVHDDVTDLPKSTNPRFGQNGKSKIYRGTLVRLQWGKQPNDGWPFKGVYPLGGWLPFDAISHSLYSDGRGLCALQSARHF